MSSTLDQGAAGVPNYLSGSEEEEEEGLFKADTVNEEDPERDRGEGGGEGGGRFIGEGGEV